MQQETKEQAAPPLKTEGDTSAPPVQPPLVEEVKVKSKQWSQGRLALSQQSCRFELPMDMKLLEAMSPKEYLSNYCIITTRRQSLYTKVFSKYKDKTNTISLKDLYRALKEVLVDTITDENIQSVCSMAELNANTHVDLKLFAGLSAISERLLYAKFVTSDTAEMGEFQKEKIESADFSSLQWKLHGLSIDSSMRNLLETIL